MSRTRSIRSHGAWLHWSRNDFVEHRGCKESCGPTNQLLHQAAAFRRREMCFWEGHANVACASCVRVFMCHSMCTYLRPTAPGTFGIHPLLVCYQYTSLFLFFSNGAASDTVHKPASASLKSASCPRIAPARSI